MGASDSIRGLFGAARLDASAVLLAFIALWQVWVYTEERLFPKQKGRAFPFTFPCIPLAHLSPPGSGFTIANTLAGFGPRAFTPIRRGKVVV